MKTLIALVLGTPRHFPLPIDEIIRKLDDDFFAGRWHRVTTRQRDLLYVISQLNSSNDEFSLAEIRIKAEEVLQKPFGNSQINQLLLNLIDQGLIYKGRHGKYFFAVPLFADFITRISDYSALKLARKASLRGIFEENNEAIQNT